MRLRRPLRPGSEGFALLSAYMLCSAGATWWEFGAVPTDGIVPIAFGTCGRRQRDRGRGAGLVEGLREECCAIRLRQQLRECCAVCHLAQRRSAITCERADEALLPLVHEADLQHPFQSDEFAAHA